MKRFDEYFSDDEIIIALCKQRVSDAKKQNDRLFWHKISSERDGAPDGDLYEFFPPRRLWKKFRPRRRGHAGSLRINEITLKNAVLALRNARPKPAWAVKLNQRIRAIRKRALKDRTFSFTAPIIIAAEKNPLKHEYRPLTVFSLDDKIIEGLTAKYLRETFDPVFKDCCLAFRCSKNGKPPPGINDALRKLLNVNRRNRQTGLYVAECDIQGFFDCVAHSVAQEALRSLQQQHARKNKSFSIDQRAITIFEAYLNAYSFPKTVLQGGRANLIKTDPQGKFKWPQKELEGLHEGPLPHGIGVPQGGALSCFIANAVLHFADQNVLAARRKTGSAVTYLRYCDDMILLSRDKEGCRATFDTYRRALRKLKLPQHQAEKPRPYSKRFWDGKSRMPYLWKKPTKRIGFPWIQFVGYQVRYDGLVRVRPKSMRKQMQKLTDSADEMLATLNPSRNKHGQIGAYAAGLRKHKWQILHRFRQKLISMSVGRRKLGRKFVDPEPLCWASGFKGLAASRRPSNMLRRLDRHRERQIQRVARRIKNLPAPVKQKGKKPYKALKHYGYTFSYQGQYPTRPRRMAI